jgi:hypothetical protein
MPDIDVSDLCDDGDIAGETFTVVRRRSVMQQNGTAALVTTYFPSCRGSLTPTGDNSLVRAEAFTTQSNTMLVITTFRLRGAGKDSFGNVFEPDIVLTDEGEAFVVSSLNEWTKFGGGFVEAECTSIDFNPMAPT